MIIDDGDAEGVDDSLGPLEGQRQFLLPTPADDEPHRYTLIMPWGAIVSFQGLEFLPSEFESELRRDQMLSRVVEDDDSPPLRYVAYGDSITQGFCGGGAPYPELISRAVNRHWSNLGELGDELDHLGAAHLEAVNLGIQGLSASHGSFWKHGEAICQLMPDLVTILIGINDCLGGEPEGTPPEGVGRRVGYIVDGIRSAGCTQTPVALITPIITSEQFAEWETEELREQIREEVARRSRDKKIVAVEGLPLLPAEFMVEGLHPSTRGQQALARNLLAELGLSRVRFSNSGCAPLSLNIWGLSAGGTVSVFYSTSAPTIRERVGYAWSGRGAACDALSLQVERVGYAWSGRGASVRRPLTPGGAATRSARRR